MDGKLITLLRRNSRESISNLANLLNLSRLTVRNRIKKLIDSNVIESFTIKLNDTVQKQPIKAMMLINLEGARADNIIHILNKTPEIIGIYSTSGRWDAIIMLEADGLAQFDVILREISSIKGMLRTETSIMLASRMKIRI